MNLQTRTCDSVWFIWTILSCTESFLMGYYIRQKIKIALDEMDIYLQFTKKTLLIVCQRLLCMQLVKDNLYLYDKSKAMHSDQAGEVCVVPVDFTGFVPASVFSVRRVVSVLPLNITDTQCKWQQDNTITNTCHVSHTPCSSPLSPLHASRWACFQLQTDTQVTWLPMITHDRYPLSLIRATEAQYWCLSSLIHEEWSLRRQNTHWLFYRLHLHAHQTV